MGQGIGNEVKVFGLDWILAPSMTAGNEMMQPGQDRQYKAIHEAAKSGKLSMDILNRNVHRVLELIVKSNSFKGYQYTSEPDLKAHAKVEAETAAKVGKHQQKVHNLLRPQVKLNLLKRK